MFATFSLLLCLLASQVSAFTFNVTFGTQSLSATQLLPAANEFVGSLAGCNANCSAAQTQLASCNDDASCLCNTTQTVKSLRDCEQCMYQSLIRDNKPLPDPKAGSTPILVGYQTACTAFNFTLAPAQVSLTLPSTWDGPFGLGLGTAGTVVTVAAGFFISTSGILILSNL
ncbi:hypothetical protein D9757_003353 [Collybiopsis confluens]|uniref:Uncharacterized protein n=1 Tax=Collybiopsis confluens TaxID=2823264 RepID=A0A8H5HZA0_9AGAR|nr:hypothetical protein D9757_003353 [Collybiopsis confluens]